MSSLHRIELSYNEVEDRILLILYTLDFQEYRFWLTRRMLKLFSDTLDQLLEMDKNNVIKHMKDEKEMSEKIQAEKEQRKDTAEKFSHRITTRPLGDQPELLIKFQCGIVDQGVFKLHLENIKGQWIEFGGDSSLISAFKQLITQTLPKTTW